jgi:hypothetical protein
MTKGGERVRLRLEGGRQEGREGGEGTSAEKNGRREEKKDQYKRRIGE